MTTIHARPRDLVEVLRRARVEGRPIALRAAPNSNVDIVRLDAGKDATVSLDAHNGVAEVDGALTLSSIARRLERLGAVFPIARPLPALSFAAACAALPYLVDAFVQQAYALTFDGDPYDTPRAPRAAAGPSLLAALCARPPLALAIRARVRVLARGEAATREQHASPRAAAARVHAYLAEGRAFAVDACGTTVLAIGGSVSRGDKSPFTHEGRGRSASFARSQSLVPGDLDAIAHALEQGARVVAAPTMGRAASLWRGGFETLPVVEVAQGAKALADALLAGGSR
jgi:hypothetical protein